MSKVRIIAEPVISAVLCFLLAASMVSFLRFENNLAVVWPVNAVILAQLLGRSLREWPRFMVAGFAGMMASGIAFSDNLPATLAFAALNSIEITLAAWLLRGSVDAQGRLLHHHASVGRFVVCAGIAAPACSAVFGGLVAHASMGMPIGLSLVTKFCADALGLLIFTPFFFAIFHGSLMASIRRTSWRERAGPVAMQGLVLATAIFVFSQAHFPLLFLPMAPLMLVAFRIGWQGTIASVLIVAVTGGIATLQGYGPINLSPVSITVKMTFLQFYLAAILGMMMPVAAALAGRRDLIDRLRESERALTMLADRSAIVLLRFDEDGTCLRAIGDTRAAMNLDADFVQGNGMEAFGIELAPRLLAAHRDALERGPEGSITIEIERPADRWIEATFRPEYDDAGNAGTVATLVDVTTRKLREGELARRAETDELTGLANRAAFVRRFANALDSGEQLSIALIDVDRFKSLNDEHGHLAGDEVLVEIARRLSHSVRASDMVARLGGDEFVIMLRTADAALAQDICQRVVRGVSRLPIALPLGGEAKAFVSCGLARGIPGQSLTEYLSRADAALYQAKRLGRNQLIAA